MTFGQQGRAGAPRALRSDVLRNRRRILDAATEAFAEQGPSAGMEHIARQAGVGSATLYRHFPAKADLIETVLVERVAAVTEVVERAAHDEEPGAALRDLVHRLVDLEIEDPTFRALLSWRDRATCRGEVAGMDRLGEVLATVIERAHDDGALRADATFGDVMLLFMALDTLSQAAGDNPPEALHRLADLTLDGFMGTRTTPAGEALDQAGLRAVAAGRH